MSGDADELLRKLELHRSLKDASPGFHIGDSDIDIIIAALRRQKTEDETGHLEGCPSLDLGPCDCPPRLFALRQGQR